MMNAQNNINKKNKKKTVEVDGGKMLMLPLTSVVGKWIQVYSISERTV